MSLLLKALQNAAKNREAGAGAENSGAGDDAKELALEPLESPSTSSPTDATSRAEPSAGSRAASDPGGRGAVDRSPSAGRSQAQNVLRAGAAGATPPEVKSGGIVEWLTRRPLIAFSTAAGLFAIGYGVYLYLQLTNPGMFVARPTPLASPPPAPSPAPQAPLPTTSAPPLAAALPDPAPPSSAPATTITPPPQSDAKASLAAATAPPTIPGPTGTDTRPAPDTPIRAAPPVPAAPSAGTLPPPASGAPAQVASARQPPIAVTPTVSDVAPAPRPARPAAAPAARGRTAPSPAVAAPGASADLAAAYQALEKGQLNDAERLYRQALAAEPRNVDAMIGLGATLTQQNRADAATQMYMRALEVDPRNSYAQAGLLSIGGRVDPGAAEGRLKELIAREPSAYLYFTLGNLYAEQNQWAAAQGAYFQAFNMAPDNPDYAFNLAVGLEHLSQPKLALDYYRRAVSIAQTRGHAQFPLAPVQARIRSLEAVLAQRP